MSIVQDNEDNAAHWTDRQFSDCMLGLAGDCGARLHLDQCMQCREELERFRSSVASFSAISTEWSERRSSTLPVPVAARPASVWLPRAAWAMAAAIALGAGLPMAMQHRDSGPAKVASTQTTAINAASDQVASVEDENSPAAIARDNAMMMAVATELNRTDPLPIAYTAQPSGQPKRRGQPREE